MLSFRRILSPAPLDSDLGLLLLRVGIGLSMLLFHGWAKITAGPERWERLGANLSNLGITFAPTMWGFLAAVAESLGAALIVLGLWTRPAALLLCGTMLVAASRHLSLPPDAAASGWKGASHALEFFVVFAALLCTGPGRHSLDRILARSHRSTDNTDGSQM